MTGNTSAIDEKSCEQLSTDGSCVVECICEGIYYTYNTTFDEITPGECGECCECCGDDESSLEPDI
jgi:hypothetical protein